MKKFFFFAAAVLASATMSAQYAHVNMTGLNDETAAVPTQAFITSEAGTLTALDAAETFKTVNVKTDGYGFFYAGETALNTDTMGVQGQNNGKDQDGGNPANTLLPYKTGAALHWVAAADGYLTVFHKASSNKQYIVFEESKPVGYEFAQLVKVGDAPEVIKYVVAGEGEYNEVKNPIKKVEEIVPTVATGDSIKSKNGESAMRFPVFAGAKYDFGATGSKMSLIGVYFSAAKEEISVAKAEGADKLVLLTAGATAVENVATETKAIKVVENGQIVIIKNGVRYNVLGAAL